MTAGSQERSSRRALPLAYIAVHDKTPLMRVLYASSNIRLALQFEPDEVLGLSAFSFIVNQRVGEYKLKFGQPSDESVVISNTVVYNKSGSPVYLRIIHFNCDDIAFNVAMTYPDVPAGTDDAAAEARRQAFEEQCRQQSTVYRSRGRFLQACLVLEQQQHQRMDDDAVVWGPRVVFASKSFETIVNLDSSDVQGLSFLELVKTDDAVKAAQFLERVAESQTVVVEKLQLVNRGWADGRQVCVEVIAAGSDDGAIILCRPDRLATRALPVDESGYASLEDIISSDPETSGLSDAWNF
ncbi:hypothetical protein H4R99_001393 [Coemansia sp. RSA 1722]|nr:hypothetical protein LPJ57_003741 [Coemansia sp. RSA 486]KAJ2235746.1 hypothetical protein IWW45_002345 [Coemansia sp. RSA 485]KAJ2605089.1 hypothetical protein H4R99_001393 [Coemansia sp. RSA 1722]KAJ2639299.1 hypothetical protein GGF40_000964 [Coemansia sp. RSA 1286]